VRHDCVLRHTSVKFRRPIFGVTTATKDDIDLVQAYGGPRRRSGRRAVTTSNTGPLIPRRRLGAAFKQLREARGETLQQTSKALMFSPSKLSRIENGSAGDPHPRDVRDLIGHFGLAATGEAARLVELAEAGRVPGWWQVPPYDATGHLDTFISYESAAARIQEYSPIFVPGILQTRRYARQVFSRLLPDAADSEIDRLTEGRLERHRRLQRKDHPPDRQYVITEAVVRRLIGTAELMVEQLTELLDVFDDPHIELRLIPFSAGIYEAVSLTTTTVFEFASALDRDVVAIERIRHTEFFERSTTVEKYRAILDHLPDVYLSTADSKKFIERELSNWQGHK
jgi:transcriptional regulator with XRE-family HTH domain